MFLIKVYMFINKLLKQTKYHKARAITQNTSFNRALSQEIEKK